MKLSDRRSWLAGALAMAVVAAGASVATSAQAAVTGCQVAYQVSSQWSGGFSANVSLTNLGDPVTSWQLTWSFTAGQTVTQLWNGSVTQSGAQVTVTNAAWNGAIGTGGTASLGFNGSSGATNPVPTDFALNGVPCTGGTSGGGPTTTPPTTTPSSGGGSLPSSFKWSSSGPLIVPKSDANHNLVAVKDASVVRFNGKWHAFLSTVNTAGSYSMEYLDFTDWSQAGSAAQSYLDQTAIGTGYKTAPQVFFFAPQKLWYLVYQVGDNAAYSTNTDISNPAGWSAPHNFYTSEPAIVQQNIGSGFWVDFWVICDSANCYLFSADDNGHIYRSQSSLANFPNGFGNGGNTVIAASDPNKFNMFEADNVYKIDGSNTYLLIVEAIGSDGHRQFRSWTSGSLAGSWTPLTATQSNPFAAVSNVTFSGTPWTNDISSGEAIRSGFDQNMTLSPCHLQYVYQGDDPASAGLPYNSLPWRIGMLTQTNSAC